MFKHCKWHFEISVLKDILITILPSIVFKYSFQLTEHHTVSVAAFQV